VAIDRGGDRPTAVSLGFFVPYMWVDNPMSLSGGREIYGFNKNWGEIALPDDYQATGLSLQAYGGDFDRGHAAGMHPLIEITRRSNGGLRRGPRVWDGVDGLADAARGLLRGSRAAEFVEHAELDLPDELFADIVRIGGPPQIFLKQFRSVADSLRASEQQITQAGVTLKRITGRPLLSDFEVTIHKLDSHPLADELGLRSQTTGLGFEVEMDFVLEAGTVLWQSPAAP
jgi:hypothetical protein